MYGPQGNEGLKLALAQEQIFEESWNGLNNYKPKSNEIQMARIMFQSWREVQTAIEPDATPDAIVFGIVS